MIMWRAMGLVPSLLLFRLIEQKNKTQEHKNKKDFFIFNCQILIKLLILPQSCGWQRVALPIGDIF